MDLPRPAALCFAGLMTAAAIMPAHAEKATLKDRFDQIVATFMGDPAAGVDIDMKHVLDRWRSLSPKPYETLTVSEARKQPTPMLAASQMARERNKDLLPGNVTVDKITIPGPAGPLAATVFMTGSKAEGARPVVLFLHGGGFVMDNADGKEATARAIASASHDIVVALDYRLAPEAKFPAAVEDSTAALRWLNQHAGDVGGRSDQIAVAGEGAGGMLAVDAAIANRNAKGPKPAALILITPAAGIDLKTNSWLEDSSARPWNKAAVEWALKLYLPDRETMNDPRIDLVGKADLTDLPPTTIVTAEVDPLRSDGERLGGRLKRATVPVAMRDYPGVTHDFFGMGEVVSKAAEAQAYVADRLKAAFMPPANATVALENLGVAPYPEAPDPATAPSLAK